MKKILTLVLCWLLAFSAMAENTFKAKTAASVAGGYVTSLNKVDGSFEDVTSQWVASVGTIVPTDSTIMQGEKIGVWSGTGTGTLDLQWTATASNTYEASAQVDVQGEDDVYVCAYVGPTEIGCKLIPALSKIQKVSVVADSVMSSAFYLRLKHTGSDAFNVKVDDGKIEPWTPQAVNLVEHISVEASGNSGEAIAINSTVPFLNESIDTHNAFSSGVFTTPKTGIYTITSTVILTTVAARQLYLKVSGGQELVSTATSADIHSATWTIRLNQGQTVAINLTPNGGTLNNSTLHKIKITGSAISENVVQSVQSKENVFSARIDPSGNIISKSSDWIQSVTQSGTGNNIKTITFKSGIFTVAPSITSMVEDASTSASVYVSSAAGLVTSTTAVLTVYNDVGAIPSTNHGITIIAQKQSPDYKDPTNLLLALPNGTETNYSITATGNAAQVITANVTDIPFIATTQNNLVWSGSSFTSPTDSIYQVSASINLSANTGNAFEYYINGSRVGRLYSQATGVSSIFPFSTTIAVPANSTFSIRPTVTATLSNTADHRLQITRVNGKIDKTFVGNVAKNQIVTVEGRTSSPQTIGTSATALILNSLVGDSTIATLSSNQITLQAGEYDVQWNIPVFSTSAGLGASGWNYNYLYNVTDASEVRRGDPAYGSTNVSFMQSNKMGNAKLTLTAAKVFELRSISTQSAGFYVGTGGSSPNDLASWVKITKLNGQ